MRSASLRPGILAFLAVLVIGMVFAACTQHAWEDYWITFRASKNLATGHGLVFEPGERLHTYTSPLGVLLPAFFSWITGNHSDGLALWLFRFTSLCALGAGVGLLGQILRHWGVRKISRLLAIVLIALDSKTIDFSINGMETGLMIFFLALTLHGLLVDGPRRIIRLGLGWAGLMWTRPDSFVYIGILALSVMIFLRDKQSGNSGWWKKLLPAGVICAVVYLPWFFWAWHYYGSPVPQTIIAKSTIAPLPPIGELVKSFLVFPLSFAAPFGIHEQVFSPTNIVLGGWYAWPRSAGSIIAAILSLAWLVPLLRPQTRMLSLGFFLGLFYLGSMVRAFAPWYLPPVAVLGYLTVGLLFDEALTFAAKLPQLGWNRGWFARLPAVLCVCAGSLVVGQAVLLVCTGREMAVQQELIENGVRKPIGLWLRDHAQSPHDTVMLEPLGYIGYYSQLKMLDYPGLSSKEMVETRRRLGPEHLGEAYLELKPDWIVLRPGEVRVPNQIINPEHLGDFYDLAAVFDNSQKVSAVGWLPGRNYLVGDQTFVVFHRKPTIQSTKSN